MTELRDNSRDTNDSNNDFLASNTHAVTNHIWGIKDVFVNIYFIQDAGSGKWVLVDAGLAGSGKKILKVASELFGDNPPAAIILTHGHFDHTGSVKSLAEHWHVPVYAHYLEFPYLSGKASYPPPDPSVGGGLMSALSPFYRKEPIDIAGHLNAMPEDGSVPFLNDWKYLHTPGHAPGHISLFRESDRVLIAGDAFVTTQPESLFATITQKKIISGPPAYFTCDWESAKKSVEDLAALNPSLVASGHGKPFAGDEMKSQLDDLAARFSSIAIPDAGRYVKEPAIADATGILYLPPKAAASKRWLITAGLIVMTIAIAGVVAANRRKNYS